MRNDASVKRLLGKRSRLQIFNPRKMTLISDRCFVHFFYETEKRTNRSTYHQHASTGAINVEGYIQLRMRLWIAEVLGYLHALTLVPMIYCSFMSLHTWLAPIYKSSRTGLSSYQNLHALTLVPMIYLSLMSLHTWMASTHKSSRAGVAQVCFHI